MSEKSVSFVIVAGGKGTRMGGEQKQFMVLGGRPLWRWSYDVLSPENINEAVLVIPQGTELRDIPANMKVPLRITH